MNTVLRASAAMVQIVFSDEMERKRHESRNHQISGKPFKRDVLHLVQIKAWHLVRKHCGAISRAKSQCLSTNF